MKFLTYMFKYYFRSQRRFWFTCLSITIAILLFCVLECLCGVYEFSADESRIIILNDVSLSLGLPLAYEKSLANVDGVDQVTYCQVASVTKDPNQPPLSILSIPSPKDYFKMMSEVAIAPEHLAKFHEERNACVIGINLAAQYGWKVDDRISLVSAKNNEVFELNVRGIYQAKKIMENNFIYCHYPYHVGKDPSIDGKVLMYIAKVNDIPKLPQVAQDLDKGFVGSFPRTRSQPERVFASNMEATQGNFALIFRTIGFVVLFATVLVVANTLIMATRQEIPQLTTLRVLGYSKTMMMVLVMSEAIFVCVVGGLFACGSAIYTLANLGMDLHIFAQGMGLAVAIGVLSGIVPMMYAAQSNLADSLRKLV